MGRVQNESADSPAGQHHGDGTFTDTTDMTLMRASYWGCTYYVFPNAFSFLL